LAEIIQPLGPVHLTPSPTVIPSVGTRLALAGIN
jgi:hypothetical protein